MVGPSEWLVPKGLGAQAFQSHGLEMGRKSTGSNPSVFPDSQVIPECLVLQYFQIHRSYQNAWSFSISRFRGPQNAWSSDAQSISSDTQHKRYKFRHPKYKFRHPKYKFRHPKYKFRHPKYSGISSDTQNISDTQNTVRYLKYKFKI